MPESYHQSLLLDITSGRVTVHTDRQLADFHIDITSGNIDTQAIQAESASVDMTSGDILIPRLDTKSFAFEATSGNIRVNALSGSGHIDMTSGDIRIDCLELAEKLSIELTSGTVDLGLANTPDLQFDGERTSGTINTYFPVNEDDNGHVLTATIGSGPYKQINVDITSGDVSIGAAE